MICGTDKPLLRVLKGEAMWPPPVWLMRQAGRYLPEYRAIRAKVDGFIKLCTSPELAAEVTLQPIRRFGFDGAILFSDILILPWALGYQVEYRDGEGPVLPPLRQASDLASLHPDQLSERIEPILQTVRRTARSLAENHPGTALIGFAGAPFTVACYLIQGMGTKDFAAARLVAYQDPALFRRLIEILTEATIAFLVAQIESGAEAVMIFDSWAGLLPPTLFRIHVIRPAQQIIAQLRVRFPTVPIIGFPRLAGLLLPDYAESIQADAIGIDTAGDLAAAARIIPREVALQGNLDPLALVAGGRALFEGVQSILTAMQGRPFIFNLGHGVLPETPVAHVAELTGLVRAG
jgi:uroporphyrinogen decarboxylase